MLQYFPNSDDFFKYNLKDLLKYITFITFDDDEIRDEILFRLVPRMQNILNGFKLNGSAPFSTFLYTTIKRMNWGLYRKYKAVKNSPPNGYIEFDEELDTPENPLEIDRKLDMASTLSKLPPNTQKVYRAFYEGFTNSEIAEMFNLKEEDIYSLIGAGLDPQPLKFRANRKDYNDYQSKYQRIYYAQNKEKVKLRNKKYIQTHRKKYNEYHRLYTLNKKAKKLNQE